MRVSLDDRPDVLGILVDGKAVPNAISYDMEAGMVEVEVPTVPRLSAQNAGTFEVGDEEVTWETRQLFGKIQLAIIRKK